MSVQQRAVVAGSAAADGWRELSTRGSLALEVSLHWNQETGAKRVTVVDRLLQEQFVLDVESADALTVFYHPFAVAASRGMSFGGGGGGGGRRRRRSHDLQPQH